uniref:Uncharacterized protein n=1 Tax=Ciona savignyi TaxID=51511 RepID=H2YW28_CIOSA
MDDIVDHDFFDDPNEDKYRSKASHENQKSFLSKLESSSSDDESSDRSHNNLHGTNGTHDGKGKSNAALKDTPSYKSPFYENDFESSDEDQFSDNEAHTEMNQISVQVKRKQRNDDLVKNKNEPNDQLNDDSSDSVTDVSPLSSPEMSPNMNRKVVKTKTGKHHKQAFLKDFGLLYCTAHPKV